MRHTKKRWRLLGSLALAALGYAAWANRRLFLVRDVTSGESAWYPEIRSRVYYGASAAILHAMEQAVKGLPGWQRVRLDPANLALDAEIDWMAGLPPDTVSAYVVSQGLGQARVIVRSCARIGFGDLGRNAAHIRQLQAAMDARLTQDAAF